MTESEPEIPFDWGEKKENSPTLEDIKKAGLEEKYNIILNPDTIKRITRKGDDWFYDGELFQEWNKRVGKLERNTKGDQFH